jgi:tetratricopeptide (TPR) repeat protein
LTFRSRWFKVLLLLGLLIAVLGGGLLYRYHTTRTPYLLARGQKALDRGDWDEAARVIRTLEDKNRPAAARLFRGKTWTYLGRAALQGDSANDAEAKARAEDAFRHALSELTRLRDGGPLGLEGTVLGAECLTRLGERRLAAETLLTVVQRQPDSRDAHRLLAAIYIDLNSPYDAIEHLREWARLDPVPGRPYRWIGFFYKDYHRPADAVAAYQEACRRALEPEEQQAVYKELAETLCEGQADYQAALDTLDQAPEALRDLPDTGLLRTECLIGLGRHADAVAEIERVLQQDPHSSRALLWRARLFLADQQPRDALVLLEKAVRLDGGDLESRQFLMQTYAQLGDRTRAEQQRKLVQELKAQKDQLTQLHEQALHHRWDDRLRIQIAELCLRINRPAEARMWLEAALACNPGNARARQLLDQISASDATQRRSASVNSP